LPSQRLRVTEPRADAAEAAAPIDPRLCAIVERLFAACFAQGQYRHALGIAIEARRLDVIYTALTHDALAGLATAADAAAVGAAAAALAAARVPVGAAAAAPPMLAHCLGACRGGGVSRGFRAHVLRLLVTVYTRLPSADYLGMAECLTQLDDAEGVAQLLAQLCDASTKAASAAASGSGAVAAAPASDDRDWLMACQVAFDLFENGTQRFVGRVRALLAPTPPAAADAAAPAADAAAAAAGAGAAAGAPTRASQLDAILSGSLPIALTVEFLCRKNATDVAILNHMKVRAHAARASPAARACRTRPDSAGLGRRPDGGRRRARSSQRRPRARPSAD
jgi:26S proteasome regulatory subunit N2